jgi:hydrogenase maturation protease
MSGNQGKPRVLIAGVGNVLRGDDGFGPAVVNALQRAGSAADNVRMVEVGIGGVGLVHEVLEGCDVLVIVDAVDRGAAPGTLFLLEPEVPALDSVPRDEGAALAVDLHEVVPGSVLLMARGLGVLPPVVRIVGCQPAETEEFALTLTPPVQRAVPAAIRMIRELIEPRHLPPLPTSAP